jgi:hypothetical protein
MDNWSSLCELKSADPGSELSRSRSSNQLPSNRQSTQSPDSPGHVHEPWGNGEHEIGLNKNAVSALPQEIKCNQATSHPDEKGFGATREAQSKQSISTPSCFA